MKRSQLAMSFALVLGSWSLVHCNNEQTCTNCEGSTEASTDATGSDSTITDAPIAMDTVNTDGAPTDVGSPSDTAMSTDVPSGTCDPTATTCPQCDLGSRIGMPAATGDTTSGTDQQMASSSCGMSAGPDVTYTWRAPSAGSFVFDTMGTSHDTIVYVRDASCSGAEVACNDDAPAATNGQSSVCITATAGQMFVVVVDGFDSTARGPFTLNIASAASCP